MKIAALLSSLNDKMNKAKGHCWFFHTWSKWEKTQRPFKRYMPDKKWHESFEFRQVRFCLDCGKNEDELI